MPLYEYQCVKCHRRTEKIENVSGPHLKKCPHCGGKAERLLATPAIQFKGSGWYVTDYAGKGGAAEKGEAKESAAKEPANKETKDKKDTKEKKATKKD